MNCNTTISELDIHLTSDCNLRCSYCVYNSGRTPFEQVSTDKLKRLFDQATELGIHELHFTGGEPTLYPDLLAMVEYAAKRGHNVRLQSNLQMVTTEYLIRLKEAGLSGIMTSIDGLKEVHETLRKGSDFLHCISLIKKASEIGLRTRINSVAMRSNISNLIELVQYIANNNICDIWSCFLISPMRDWTNENYWMNGTIWNVFLQQLSDIAKKHTRPKIVAEAGFLKRSIDKKKPQLKGCGAGCTQLWQQREYVMIKADGEAFPCVFFSQLPEWSLGNVYRDGLRFIASDEAWQRYKPLMIVPDRCKGCHEIEWCQGGCRGYALLSGQDINCMDPRCGEYAPLCPVAKINLTNDRWGGSSEEAIGGK